ncbi:MULTISPECIES: hypothetical protein [unclassified Mesorhizobium]|nr:MULTISPECIES: hypothetical protein [unclassified Mesorhizobium]
MYLDVKIHFVERIFEWVVPPDLEEQLISVLTPSEQETLNALLKKLLTGL